MTRAPLLSYAFLSYLAFPGAAYAHGRWYDIKYPGGVRSTAQFEADLSNCSQHYGDDPVSAGLRKCMLGFGWRFEET